MAIDEAYIAFGGESAAQLIKEYANLLVIRTFSKSSSLAGLMRLGYAVGCEKLIETLTTVKDSFNSYPVDFIAQKCGELGDSGPLKYSRISQSAGLLSPGKNFVKQASVTPMAGILLPSKANFVFARKGRLISGTANLQQNLKRKSESLSAYFDKPMAFLILSRITIGTDDEMKTLI